jgi:putative hemolysin
MKSLPFSKIIIFSLGLSISHMCAALVDEDPLGEYCVSKSGTLTPMTAWFETNHGPIEGLTERFCTFERDNGYLAIGLTAFASDQPNIAATYMKTLPEIKEGSELLPPSNHHTTGFGLANPSHYVCEKLGGTTISFKFRGNFRPKNGGDSDICTFGDGSMVSAWTLIYMANHRAGYDEVKGYVKSQPLPYIP